jgi:zinc transporter ZupT
VIHKIPVALILGGFLLHSRRTKKSGWFFMVLFSIMTPIGALLGTIDIITSIYPYLLALVIGVVLHVATIILFESSEGHSLPWRKLLVILAGMVLGYCL